MTFSDQDRALSLESRKSKPSPINTRGRSSDRRSPGEVRSRKDSIISFCSECITSYGDDVGGHGSIKNAIRNCTAPECHLYPWRLGVVDEES